MNKEQGTKNKHSFISGVLGLLTLVLLPLSANAAVFYRDLSEGDSGEDVRTLQAVLNSRVETQVADIGAGSPGAETDFFGPKTSAAVIRYQNLYSSDILAPLGLSSGTGYVGSLTRAKLSGESVAETASGYPTGQGVQATSFEQALANFDIVAKSVVGATPSANTPKTQEEMITAFEEFSGGDTSEEAVQAFVSSQVRNIYGLSEVGDNPNDDFNRSTTTQPKGTSTKPTRGDADIDSTGAGCIGLLLDLLGL